MLDELNFGLSDPAEEERAFAWAERRAADPDKPVLKYFDVHGNPLSGPPKKRKRSAAGPDGDAAPVTDQTGDPSKDQPPADDPLYSSDAELIASDPQCEYIPLDG